MSSRGKGNGAKQPIEQPRVPAKTVAQRLKRVAAVAIPAVEEVRARVAELNARVDDKLADVLKNDDSPYLRPSQHR